MIKTYKARVNQNNVSYLLSGKQGNQVRYPFANGNVIINKYPSLTLRNRYYQDLLESSLLFADQTIIIDHEEEEYPGEKAALEAEKKEAEERKNNPTLTDPNPIVDNPVQHKITEEASVRTNADLVNFVNTIDNRTEKNAFTTPARALKWATEHYYHFPNYEPE